MDIRQITVTGISATSFMTLYSYVLSEITERHYREPELLAQLLHRLAPALRKRYARVIGWKAHYIVGLLFAAIYIYLWQQKGIRPTLASGLLLGGISGLVAIGVWKLVLKMHPLPPQTAFKKFYGQLLPAHLVFGAAAVLTYREIKD